MGETDFRARGGPPVRRHGPFDREQLRGVQQGIGGYLVDVHQSVEVRCRMNPAHRSAFVNVPVLANRTYCRIVAPVAVATRSAVGSEPSATAVKPKPVTATKSVSLAESWISPSTVPDARSKRCQYAEAPNAVEAAP